LTSSKRTSMTFVYRGMFLPTQKTSKFASRELQLQLHLAPAAHHPPSMIQTARQWHQTNRKSTQSTRARIQMIGRVSKTGLLVVRLNPYRLLESRKSSQLTSLMTRFVTNSWMSMETLVFIKSLRGVSQDLDTSMIQFCGTGKRTE